MPGVVVREDDRDEALGLTASDIAEVEEEEEEATDGGGRMRRWTVTVLTDTRLGVEELGTGGRMLSSGFARTRCPFPTGIGGSIRVW